MNKILISGLALGIDCNESLKCSNYDISWLINYPSTLLWAEKILITETIWKIIKNEAYKPIGSNEISKAIKLIFEYADDNNLIEIINPKTVFHDNLLKHLENNTDIEIKALANAYPDSIKLGIENVPGGFNIENNHMCYTRILTYYYALFLSKFYKANCLFDNDLFLYQKYLFQLSAKRTNEKKEDLKALNTIFSIYLPQLELFPNYIIGKDINKENCESCKGHSFCKDNYLIDLENNLKNYFIIKEYDEIQQIKEIINTISKSKSKINSLKDHKEIVNNFEIQKKRIQKKLYSSFPKIERWSNVSMIISIPIALIGLISNINSLTIYGSIFAGLSSVSDKYIKFLQNKYSWINFLNKNIIKK